MSYPRSVPPVEIRVPPHPPLIRVVRLVAGGVASLAGCSVADLEKVRLVVSEMMNVLFDGPGRGMVKVEFGVDDGVFAVTGTATPPTRSDAHILLSEVVLEELGARQVVTLTPDETRIRASVSLVSAE